MDILHKLRELFQPPNKDRNHWFYVRCNVCKEVLKGRIDLFNNLSQKFEEGSGKSVYYCRKVMIGSKGCYKPIEVEYFFDMNRKVIDRRITGGEYVTEQDYLELFPNGG
jgi:hypothetical protein